MRQRLEAFVSQLEVALHLMAGGIRVGLSMRQALASVIDELPNPARYEFRRVIGQTNIGVSMLDAMDDLARRMPNNETLMVARVFRVQSQTGGDLARILDQLAETIKGRRQVHRKIDTLTAEGKMSAWVLMSIPLGLGLFICTTQETMGHALLYTPIGHITCSSLPAWRPAPFSGLRTSCGSTYDVALLGYAIPGLFAAAAFFFVLSLLPSKSVLTQQLEELQARDSFRRDREESPLVTRFSRPASVRRSGDCSPRPAGTRRRPRSSSCESSRERASERS